FVNVGSIPCEEQRAGGAYPLGRVANIRQPKTIDIEPDPDQGPKVERAWFQGENVVRIDGPGGQRVPTAIHARIEEAGNGLRWTRRRGRTVSPPRHRKELRSRCNGHAMASDLDGVSSDQGIGNHNLFDIIEMVASRRRGRCQTRADGI